jgi:exosortase
MSATAIPITAPPASSRKKVLLSVAAMVVTASAVYAWSLPGLMMEWWTNDDYSHGLLLPFAISYLIYEKRAAWSKLPLRGHWSGLILIALSQVVQFLGFLGAEFFLQRTSFVVLIAGVVLFVCGWEFLKEVSFILLMIVLTIPLPALIFNAVALPLQLLASRFSEMALTMLNIPIYREGNILQLPNLTLSVAEACSGIRSLMSLITLGVMISYFLSGKWWMRAVMIASTIPLAIGANVFRVAATGVLARYYGEKASTGFFHSFSGWVVFVIAFVVLTAELRLMNRFARRQTA